jgi:hypothetical protein
MVDGNEIDSNIVPPAPEGATVKVEAVIGG